MQYVYSIEWDASGGETKSLLLNADSVAPDQAAYVPSLIRSLQVTVTNDFHILKKGNTRWELTKLQFL